MYIKRDAVIPFGHTFQNIALSLISPSISAKNSTENFEILMPDSGPLTPITFGETLYHIAHYLISPYLLICEHKFNLKLN
jgi:hypothetical protein